MADIIMFVPRSNPNSDRAFWKGPDPDLVGMETVAKLPPFRVTSEQVFWTNRNSDTAPAEYNYQAPADDPA